ncbi:hypothetical protein JR316_0005258 [Psilocybe cubensis]|uniref:F-box domain-containing protein n=2 Tax=Psilocybe cubensis TaxID=181762 RepID=A0A8H7XXU4_PSICU|nr:hypothetical protein JR316_0005258 [Psilocybe cubensis]KAH9483155.1 hypothetical protein JR316_0005258 [Psilocybe cubensis]
MSEQSLHPAEASTNLRMAPFLGLNEDETKLVYLCPDEEILPTTKRLDKPQPPSTIAHPTHSMYRSAKDILDSRRYNEIFDLTAQLPVDICTTIYKLVLPTAPEHDSFYDIHQEMYLKLYRTTLLKLATVCHRWRLIIIRTRWLWNLVPLVFTANNLGSATALAKLWLSRTGRLPLSINIYIPHDPEIDWTAKDNEKISEFRKFSDVINACSDRWNCLDLRVPGALLSNFVGRPKKLEMICVGSTTPEPYYNDYVALATKTNDEEKPTPTILVISRVQFEAIDASWAKLTRVTGRHISMFDIFDILEQATRLEFFELECVICDNYSIQNAWATTITHQHLRFLKIIDVRTSALKWLCADNLITFPCLNMLHINVQRGDFLPTFYDFLHRSGGNVQHMTFIAPLSDKVLFSMLSNLPCLLHLDLGATLFSERGFTAERILTHLLQHHERYIKAFKSATGELLGVCVPEVPLFVPVLKHIRYRTMVQEEYIRICNLVEGLEEGSQEEPAEKGPGMGTAMQGTLQGGAGPSDAIDHPELEDGVSVVYLELSSSLGIEVVYDDPSVETIGEKIAGMMVEVPAKDQAKEGSF